MVHTKVANKVADDVESAMVEQEKLEPEGEEKMAEVSVVNIEPVELEDKFAPFVEANAELSYLKQASDDTMAMKGEEALKESIEKVVDVSTREASTVVSVHHPYNIFLIVLVLLGCK